MHVGVVLVVSAGATGIDPHGPRNPFDSRPKQLLYLPLLETETEC